MSRGTLLYSGCVCFLGRQIQIFSMVNVTDHGDEGWNQLEGHFEELKQIFGAKEVTQLSCRFEIGGHKGTHSIGCCNVCQIQSIAFSFFKPGPQAKNVCYLLFVNRI